ncbi:MAG: hypothetical protein ACR2LL_09300 [Nitrosopumilus sp.]
MNIKCPCCNHKFPVSEDSILLDYSEDVNYNDPEKYVWEELPLLKSGFRVVCCSEKKLH